MSGREETGSDRGDSGEETGNGSSDRRSGTQAVGELEAVRLLLGGFAGHGVLVHALVLLGGVAVFAAAYILIVQSGGGFELAYVTGARGIRRTAAAVAALPTGVYFGLVTVRGLGGPATNPLAALVVPVSVPGWVAELLSGRTPDFVFTTGSLPARYEDTSGSVLVYIADAGVVLLPAVVGVAAVVYLWWRKQGPGAGRRWIETHLPERFRSLSEDVD